MPELIAPGRRYRSFAMDTRPIPRLALAMFAGLLLVVAGCGADDTASPSTVPASGATSTTVAAAGGSIVNTWSGATVDPKRLPLGDGKVSTTAAATGAIFACSAGNPNGAGAQVAGTWIDVANRTWDMTKKLAVQGSRTWEAANFTEAVKGADRVLTTNGLPVRTITGTFPIATTDPAYAFDKNPNSIKPQTITTLTLPVQPTPASKVSCLGMGAIGIVRNGVFVFASLDERNRDAVAYETQDACDGHPQQSGTYHYHDVPSCLRTLATGASVVVGFANDGYPIVIERDAAGNLPTNADLDECHGRTSPVDLDGATTTMYHYSATLEFPYFIGCYHGTPVTKR